MSPGPEACRWPGALLPGLDTTGRVSEAEHADDGGTYSVEVIVEGGRHIEVKLDDNVHVIKHANDDDSRGHDGSDTG